MQQEQAEAVREALAKLVHDFNSYLVEPILMLFLFGHGKLARFLFIQNVKRLNEMNQIKPDEIVKLAYPNGISKDQTEFFITVFHPAMDSFLRKINRSSSKSSPNSQALDKRILELFDEGNNFRQISTQLRLEGTAYITRDAVGKRYRTHRGCLRPNCAHKTYRGKPVVRSSHAPEPAPAPEPEQILEKFAKIGPEVEYVGSFAFKEEFPDHISDDTKMILAEPEAQPEPEPEPEPKAKKLDRQADPLPIHQFADEPPKKKKDKVVRTCPVCGKKAIGQGAVARGQVIYCSQTCNKFAKASEGDQTLIDGKILSMSRRGVTPTDIAAHLGNNFGGPWTADLVIQRHKELAK